MLKVYGPYLRKDNRKHVILIDKEKNLRRTISYPKYLLMKKLNREFKKNETTDHVDEDFTNDNISNLQILSRKNNARKAIKSGKSSPKHLIEYSRSKKGRLESKQRFTGQSNPKSLFTDKQVIRLRNKYERNVISIKEIMIKYSATDRSVRNMLKGRTYSHLSGAIKKRLKN